MLVWRVRRYLIATVAKYLGRIVSDANIAGIANDAVDRVGTTAQVVRLIPRQDDGRLVNKVDGQILRLGWRFYV